MINRRGHIGTIALVFGALFLVVSALFSFIGFTDNTIETKKELRKLSLNAKYDSAFLDKLLEIVVSKSLDEVTSEDDFKIKFEERLKENANEERLRTGIDEKNKGKVSNNLFTNLALGQFVVDDVGTDYILRVNDLQIKNEFGKHEIIQRFDLTVKFNKLNVIEIVRIPKYS